MKVLVVGGGGREHALAWKLAQSPRANRIYVAPGNAGTANECKIENIEIEATDIPALLRFALDQRIDLTVVGPEAPLAAGIADSLSQHGLLCFGPSQAASRLESSKAFSKSWMEQLGIPTAKHRVFTDHGSAIQYLRSQTFPVVIKADGLAAGKGVIIAQTLSEAEQAVERMLLQETFGQAGRQIVIEDHLEGVEISYMVMTDGHSVLPLASSQDHKALFDGDKGPNTGGMGAYSPAPSASPSVERRILTEIIQPLLAGLRAQACPYLGFLYAGIMLTPDGTPMVLEFNCRLGDPEAQVILPRLRSDLLEHCLAACHHQLSSESIEWDPNSCVGVVMASGGYPNQYQRGLPIAGLQALNQASHVFHAGTKLIAGQTCTNGGRVLCVTQMAPTIQVARQRAYTDVQQINWKDCYYRNDIAHKAL